MPTDYAALEAELTRLRADLHAAQAAIHRLEQRPRLTGLGLASMLTLVVLALSTWSLSAQGAGQTVRAPFKIVDGSNKTILVITDSVSGLSRGAHLYDSGSHRIGLFGEATQGGGLMRVMTSTSIDSAVSMGAGPATIGWTIRKAGVLMAVADAGLSGSGGVINALTSTGTVAASMMSVGNRGQVSVFNASGMPIAFITESDKHPGAGNVTATDPNGQGVFSAGYDGTGGEACATLKTGLWCLGKNIPLSIK